jgi:AraC family transcriptional regulator of adaptative response/methylated-DNA-[protein]-cysteine methyltransferase
MNTSHLLSLYFDTPLGKMVAVSNRNGLCLLDFVDRKNIDKAFIALENHYQASIMTGFIQYNEDIKDELALYFTGQLKHFTVPIASWGTPFQKRVWSQLMMIRHGTTKSYQEIAQIIGQPGAYRAVANANAANYCSIIIPCHRVIASNGNISGYGGGIDRKKWLLKHEALY